MRKNPLNAKFDGRDIRQESTGEIGLGKYGAISKHERYKRRGKGAQQCEWEKKWDKGEQLNFYEHRISGHCQWETPDGYFE